MKYTYELIAIFDDGDKKVIKKSNKNINEIDEFTSQFNNKSELINHLEDLFDKVIFDAKIKYTYLAGETETKKTLDIVYKNDVFDTNELIEKYSNYLRKSSNINELRRFIYMLYSKVSVNIKESFIEEIRNDLETEVTKYLNSYRKKRDVYFKLKKDDIKVKNKVVKNNFKHDTMKEHVSKFKSDDAKIDDILNTLDLDAIFSVYDLDDLKSVRSKLTDSPLVDGLYKDKGKKR